MASGADHEVDLVERDRLLEALQEYCVTAKPALLAVETRASGPTSGVQINVALVESITEITAPANSGWIPLGRKR